MRTRPDADRPRTTLYVRSGCHLCAAARAVVAEACGARGEQWEERDVDTDAGLRAAYGDTVPVVEVDGVQVGFWRIDAARLQRALEGRRRSLLR